MNRILVPILLFCAICLVASRPAFAAITIDTVPVDDVGNGNDPLTGGLYGGVGYAYNIGTTEVTVGQYTAFLNAVAATDTYALYNTSMASNLNIAGISRSGVSSSYSYSVIGSANKPVTYVSWGDAARFSNWLYNGQPGLGGPAVPQNAASTEDGSYTLNGATTDTLLNGISRNAGATWVIPTENEWYKAAYYQPAAHGGPTDNYWDYPTRTDITPYSDQPPGNGAPTQSNTANFFKDDNTANGYNDGYAVTGTTSHSSSQNYLTDAGAYSQSISYYGTFDQGGNVAEWNETLIISDSFRGLRGGSWTSPFSFLQSSSRFDNNPTNENFITGFRVAEVVPEPSTAILAALGLLGVAALRQRCIR